MEHQLWKAIVAVLATLDKPRNSVAFDYSDEDIVKVLYWAVIHDRPASWAVQRCNWPIHLRKKPLPSNTTMSRRLRTKSVRALLNALEQRVVAPQQVGLFCMIDGKPLSISGCSKDKQAGYGRAANCKAKGYKIHAIVGSDGAVASWRVAPMNYFLASFSASSIFLMYLALSFLKSARQSLQQSLISRPSCVKT